ncbi:MAG: transcriptional repressor [Flavobacteriales bacterium]|nr:transcriptional repressor [Flavobacteriales bacterium]
MEADKLLRKHNLRVTGFRKEVLALFNQRSAAVDSRTIEKHLQPADRVTVYRTLRTFEDSGIIHRIPDPTGAVKFALCNDGCNDLAHHHSHAHFHCNTCAMTICLDGHGQMPIDLPSGYTANDIQTIVCGVCAACNRAT